MSKPIGFTKDEFDIEMIRRERRLIPVLRDFYRFFIARQSPSSDFKSAALEALLWTVFSPGTVVAAGAGFAALATAAFSGWAAFETKRSADIAAKATQAAVWIRLLEEYADPKVPTAMSRMREFQEKHAGVVEDSFLKALLRRDSSNLADSLLQQLESDRRLVCNFFDKVTSLVEAKVIGKDLVYGTWSSGLLPFILDVVIPMEIAKARSLFAQKRITEDNLSDGMKKISGRIELWKNILSPPAI